MAGASITDQPAVNAMAAPPPPTPAFLHQKISEHNHGEYLPRGGEIVSCENEWRMSADGKTWCVGVVEKGLSEEALSYPSRKALAPWTNQVMYSSATNEYITHYST